MTHDTYEIAPMYAQMRGNVLELVPNDIDQETGLLAVLMEIGYPEAVATLVVVVDGTTSLYFSNGGGVIGAGEHVPVRQASGCFLDCAVAHADHFEPVTTAPLPGPGHVRFQVVTDAGVFTAEASEDDLGNRRHPLAPLFHEGHNVLTQIREHTPQ